MQQEHENQQEVCEYESTEFSTYEDLMDAGKISFTDIKEHISGPVISIILHVFLLAFLATIIVIEIPKDSNKKIEVEIVRMPPPPEIKKIKEIPEIKPEEIKVDVKIERPQVKIEKVSEIKVEKITTQVNEMPIEIPNVLKVKPTNSAKICSALICGGPRTGPGRDKAIGDYGGSDATESALLRGLHWLKDNQNADGSWGDSAKSNYAAYTGMALLAFLAYGDGQDSEKFQETIRKAIKRLVEMVGPEADKVKGGYRHGIAMYALAEAYALTGIPMLEDVVNKGIARIIRGMNASGSFDYGYSLKGRSDLSVAGWNYQALKAAFYAGCKAEGLEDAISKGVKTGLKSTHYDSSKQMFCYGAGSGAKSTMTAVGVLCLQLYGEGRSQEAKAGLETLQKPNYFWFSWDHNPTAEEPPGWALYQWYYQTQAIFQGNNGKGKNWKAWNNMFSSQLIIKQKEDGRWESPAYEHNPTKKGHGEAMFKGLDQPVYSTALCCLMLEVYYRYLPTFKVAKVINPDQNGDNAKVEDNLGLSLEPAL